MMDITRNVPYRIIKILLDNPIYLILLKVTMKNEKKYFLKQLNYS